MFNYYNPTRLALRESVYDVGYDDGYNGSELCMWLGTYEDYLEGYWDGQDDYHDGF